MKKLFLVAAVAAIGLASCAKSEATEGTARITLRIAGAQSGTRAVETAAGSAQNPVTPTLDPAGNHIVWVINAGTVIHLEALNLAEAQGSGQIIGATANAGSQKYFPTTSSVFVVGNVPSNFTPGNYGVDAAFSDLEAATSEISYALSINTDYTKPAMANESGAVTVTTTGTNTATVTVNLKPLYSRIELKELKAGTHIKSYEVSGVYLNNYNTTFTMAGTGNTSSLHTANGNPPYGNGWFGDYSTTTSISSTAAGDVTTALVPAAGKVWAYSVAPGSVPTFIIELKNIVQYADDSANPGTPTTTTTSIPGPKYVTVTGYTGLTDATFMRGKIYQVGTVNFNWDDIRDTPIPTGVAITADVNILPWDYLPLAPVVQ